MYSFLSTQRFVKFILLLPLLLLANQAVGMVQASTGSIYQVELQSTTLGETANFELTKTVSSSTAQPGERLTYEITVKALNEAVNISLTDDLPAGLTYVADSATNGATFSNGEIRYTGLIQPDTPLQINYQARVDANIAPGSILYNVVQATGAQITHEAAVAVAIPETQSAQTLVLLYVNGDNDLSDYMLNLVNRAEEGASNPELTVLLLLDGPREGDTYLYRLQEDKDGSCPNYSNPTCDGRYVLGQTMWEWHENVATPDSLAQFLIGAQHAYPENNQILLSLVGHGGGWNSTVLPGRPLGHGRLAGGLLWDENPGSELSMAELGQALASFHEATGRQIDLLYLDACLMAMSEVAYEIRDSVKYLLASESWTWTSFRYDEHLEKIEPDSTAREIGEQWLQNEAAPLRYDNYAFTYSLLDISQMTAFRTAQDELAQRLITVLPGEKEAIDKAFDKSDCFDSNADSYIVQPNNKEEYQLPLDNYCDLDSFVRELQEEFSDRPEIVEAAGTLRDVISQTVLLKDTHNGFAWQYSDQRWEWEQLGGISTYLPLIEDDWRRRYYNPEQLQSAEDGLWDDFLTAYWSEGEIPIDPECPPEGCDLPQGPLPTVPIHIRASAGEESINLRWRVEGTLEEEFNRYQVLRNANGGDYSVIASSLNTQYTDNDAALTSGTDYCYQIQALDNTNQIIGESNTICVEFGELTVWIEDQVAPSGSKEILVPINLENGNELCIGAMNITIGYDTSIITATGTVSPTIFTEGYAFVVSTNTPGQVSIASITGIEQCKELYGPGSLFNIGFEVIGAQDTLTSLDFTPGLTGTVLYDNENLNTPVDLALSNGLLTVDNPFVRGDLNGDGTVNSADALLALQFATLLNIPSAQQIAACDINGDNSCNSADASLILCYAAHQDWDECGGSQSLNRFLESTLPQTGQVQVGIHPTASRAGDTFVTSVVLTNGLTFSGGDFTFTYDASRMVPTNVSLTSLTNDFLMESNRQQPGILKVAMASQEPIEADGAILEIQFKRINGTSNLDLASVRLNDATGRDFESSALQRDIELIPFTGGTISLFLPTIMR